MRRGTQGRIVDRRNVDWEEFDPRMTDFNVNNSYTSGPGMHLPPNVPYAMRQAALPFKLFVNGIQPSVNEDGIRNIFSNYGYPLSIVRTRNKYQRPIAFVEFQSQCEADNAICHLNGKPPLNWEVCYAMPRKTEEELLQQLGNLLLESDFERHTHTQTPMFQTCVVGSHLNSRQSAGLRNTECLMERGPVNNNVVKASTLPPCVVCGTPAAQYCSMCCETRYCNKICQGRDWPTHQFKCKPLMVPEAGNRNSSNDNRATSKQASAYEKTFPSRLKDRASGVIQQDRSNSSSEIDRRNHQSVTSEARSQSSTIQRHPVDKTVTSNLRPVDLSVTVRNISNVGSRPKTPEIRIVQNFMDIPAHSERCHVDRRGLNPRPTAEAQPSNSCLRSPNTNNNAVSSQNNIRRSISPMDNQQGTREQQYANYSSKGAIPRSHNVSLANNYPRIPIASPLNRAPQSQTSKIYATKFSSTQLSTIVNTKQAVSVCFSKSPSEFFIQYFKFQDVIIELTERIQKSAATADPLVNPVEGLPCLALYTDDNWYRAEILQIFEDDGSIGVRFVDFGNTMKMPNTFQSFRRMEQSLSKDPFYAIKVKLADILPVNGNSWEKDVKMKFKDIVSSKVFHMECVQVDADVMSVRLKFNEDGSDLVSRLLKENLVKGATLQASDELDRIPSAEGTPSLSRLQDLVQKQHIRQKQLHGTSSLINRPQDLVQVNGPKELAATNLMAPSQTSPTRAALRQDACVIQPRAPTMPSVPVRPISLPIQQNVAAVSSTPSTPNGHSVLEFMEVGTQFCFQVVALDGQDRFRGLLVHSGKDVQPIFEFNSFAENIKTLPNFKPSVGSIVAVQSSTDSQWYRGYITKVLKSSYNVFYVDYGNEEEVFIDLVKPIPASFQHETLSVRLSFIGDLATSTKLYADTSMVQESTHDLEIILKRTDGSVEAKFVGEDVPTCVVKIEPWTSILAKPEMFPARNVSYTKCEPNISSPNWEVGFSCDVIPFAAEDVDCIYVQTITDETAELTAKIQKELKAYSPYSVPLKSVPDVGIYVAAIFSEDNDLYRAQIIDINGETVNVRFVDFGNLSTVTLAEIRELPPCFYDYPACSRRISLARVVRPAGYLPTTVQELLSNCISKIHKMIVLQPTSELTECTLLEDGQVLNEQVCDCFELLTANAASNSPRKMPELKSATPTDDAIPEDVVPVDNTLCDLNYGSCSFFDLPEDGSFEAVVTSVEGPQLIMMHAADDHITKKLSLLEEKITSYATTVQRGHGPKEFEMCLARFPDGQWYRAACLEVIACPAGNRYRCVNVDYGETHIIDIDDIRRIPRRFIDSLSLLAQHAILEGTDSIEIINNDLSDRFNEVLPKNSTVTVSVVSRCQETGTYIVRIPKVKDILAEQGLL